MIKKMIFKTYTYIKNNKLETVLLLLAILSSPIIIIDALYRIGDLLNHISIKTIFKPIDILNYSGVIIGAVLGGLVTFGALYITI